MVRPLTRAEQAAALGVAPGTITHYRRRYANTAHPYPDPPTWAALTAWNAARPGKGGRPRLRSPALTNAAWRNLHALIDRGETPHPRTRTQLIAAGFIRELKSGELRVTAAGRRHATKWPLPGETPC